MTDDSHWPNQWTRTRRIAIKASVLIDQHHSATDLANIRIMEFFAKLMSCIGASYRGIDFIACLPVEIAETILLKLDPRSLLNAARVSTKWMAVCKGSPRLRRTARRHLRKEKKRNLSHKVMGFWGRVTASICVKRSPTIAEVPPQGVTFNGRQFKVLRVDGRSRLKATNGQNPTRPPNRSTIPTRSSLRL